MKIAKKYSHLNGEEYLIVHRKKLYGEIIKTIESINLEEFRTKISKERTKKGRNLFSPKAINQAFEKAFRQLDWKESRYRYYVTNDFKLMQELVPLSFEEQRSFLGEKGIKDLITSYKQTDFVKNQVAVEVQFGKYAFVAFDLFVKHLLFYSGNVINLGVEILPTKKMQSQMSSGVAYYEGEVYNVMRHGRNNPLVPLLILGVE